MKREERIQQVVDMMTGIREPTREVIDWLNEQNDSNNLTLWEKSTIALAESLGYHHDEVEIQYQLYRNIMDAFGRLHNVKIYSHGEIKDEIDEEIAMMLDWFDAFDEIDDYSGEFTSEEMLVELS